jgi:hypothetical protein
MIYGPQMDTVGHKAPRGAPCYCQADGPHKGRRAAKPVGPAETLAAHARETRAATLLRRVRLAQTLRRLRGRR